MMMLMMTARRGRIEGIMGRRGNIQIMILIRPNSGLEDRIKFQTRNMFYYLINLESSSPPASFCSTAL